MITSKNQMNSVGVGACFNEIKNAKTGSTVYQDTFSHPSRNVQETRNDFTTSTRIRGQSTQNNLSPISTGNRRLQRDLVTTLSRNRSSQSSIEKADGMREGAESSKRNLASKAQHDKVNYNKSRPGISTKIKAEDNIKSKGPIIPYKNNKKLSIQIDSDDVMSVGNESNINDCRIPAEPNKYAIAERRTPQFCRQAFLANDSLCHDHDISEITKKSNQPQTDDAEKKGKLERLESSIHLDDGKLINEASFQEEDFYDLDINILDSDYDEPSSVEDDDTTKQKLRMTEAKNAIPDISSFYSKIINENIQLLFKKSLQRQSEYAHGANNHVAYTAEVSRQGENNASIARTTTHSVQIGDNECDVVDNEPENQLQPNKPLDLSIKSWH